MNQLKLIHLDDAIDRLPTQTRIITAQYDAEGIIVYQAYNPEIAEYALQHQQFGGAFKFGRMTWVKPNFLWMMHRSDWASRENQERILAIKLSHVFFETLLEKAVLTSYVEAIYHSKDNWKTCLENAEVRVQWDPAYDVYDQKLPHKAIQIGCKGETATQYAKHEIIQILDVTDYAHWLHKVVLSNQRKEILLPEECSYPVSQHLQQPLLMG